MPTYLLAFILVFASLADTSHINSLISKAANYNLENIPDSSYLYGDSALKLATGINNIRLQAASEYQIGKALMIKGEYINAMERIINAERLFRTVNDSNGMGQANMQLGVIEYTQKNYLDALPYFNTSYSISDKINNKKLASTNCYLIGRIYLETNQLQKAELLFNMALRAKKELGNSQGYYECISALAELNFKKGDYINSKKLYQEALIFFNQSDNPNGMAVCHFGLANAFNKSNQPDSALYHYNLSYRLSSNNNYRDGILKSTKSLAEFFQNEKEYKKALDFLEQYHEIHDSIFNVDNTRKLAKIQNQLRLAQKQIEIDQLSRQKEKDADLQKVMALIIAVLITFAIIVFRFYRSEQKSKRELKIANEKLEQTLADLKNAEQQLIRSEKLASLGQLTASVAHELKNPLNFIINFSESSSEILSELQAVNSGLTGELISELKTNLQRIENHGNRATSIITNMMMHARHAAKEKSISNISTLLRETTELACQSMRASKPDFHCKINSNIPNEKIMANIIEQEVGRVILNLLNNAFYATSLRIGTENYKPEIKINLSTNNSKAVITIEDNGTGMDKETLSRIFEPFFTTKPTGEGTGLGLSMSYDMIQSNGGTISVESEKMKYTRFTITIPLAV